MSWAEPGWFWLFGAVALVAAVALGGGRRHLAALRGLFGPALLDRVLPPSTRLRRVVRDVALVLGLLGLVVALAEPRFGKTLRELEAEGVDLVLVVDLSRSMDATDVDPSRLERARREILDLVRVLEGDRVGLVMFAGGAYPRMPLTLDYRALELMVRELDTRTFQAQGSELGPALREAQRLLQGQAGQAGQAVLVLTDGELHDHDEALAAARELAAAQITVYGMVIGTDRVPIPNGDGSFLVEPSSGVRVMTEPSDTDLLEIARITGGAVVRSVASDADTSELYAGQIRSSVRAAVGRTSKRATWNTAFPWPLGVGLALLLGSAWLGDGRKVGLVLAALLVALPAQAAPSLRDGDAAYRAQRYDEAARIFTELSLERPDDADLLERLGAARYRAGDYNGAARAWEQVQALRDGLDSTYNAGNAWWQAGRLDEARRHYEEVLAADPDHEAARRNLQALQQELQMREMAQHQQRPEPQQGDPQDGDGEQQEGEQAPRQGGEPQGDEPQDGQQGEQQQPQEGQAQQAQAQQGEEGQEGQQGDAQAQAGTPEDDGTRSEDGRDGEQDGVADLDQLGQPEGEGQGGGEEGSQAGATQGEGSPSGMTPEQADRILEGVEEGRPRVYVPGGRSSKPW
ncbi:MAG: VWA domain-containing protein [Alphaproteobacteria bacterium]|nr:VWA domain-containing protein [Alphaproteobacteria bacterium]